MLTVYSPTTASQIQVSLHCSIIQVMIKAAISYSLFYAEQLNLHNSLSHMTVVASCLLTLLFYFTLIILHVKVLLSVLLHFMCTKTYILYSYE